MRWPFDSLSRSIEWLRCLRTFTFDSSTTTSLPRSAIFPASRRTMNPLRPATAPTVTFYWVSVSSWPGRLLGLHLLFCLQVTVISQVLRRSFWPSIVNNCQFGYYFWVVRLLARGDFLFILHEPQFFDCFPHRGRLWAVSSLERIRWLWKRNYYQMRQWRVAKYFVLSNNHVKINQSGGPHRNVLVNKHISHAILSFSFLK